MLAVLTRRGGWRVWPLQSPREKTKRSTRHGVSLSTYVQCMYVVIALFYKIYIFALSFCSFQSLYSNKMGLNRSFHISKFSSLCVPIIIISLSPSLPPSLPPDCPQVQAIYDYKAAQPDELSLERGDVVKVYRKMADGKLFTYT